MEKPDWFLIIQQWKKRMGNIGVTLPFLVGALKLKSEQTSTDSKTSQEILDIIINRPVNGYVTEVRRCPNIYVPVLSVVQCDDKKNRVVFKSFFNAPDSETQSLVFSSDIHSEQGLNCTDKDDCLKKLIESADEYISRGQYSRQRNQSSPEEYSYGDFSNREIEFIKSVIMANE